MVLLRRNRLLSKWNGWRNQPSMKSGALYPLFLLNTTAKRQLHHETDRRRTSRQVPTRARPDMASRGYAARLSERDAIQLEFFAQQQQQQ
jgi:hypothetical protein